MFLPETIGAGVGHDEGGGYQKKEPQVPGGGWGCVVIYSLDAHVEDNLSRRKNFT